MNCCSCLCQYRCDSNLLLGVPSPVALPREGPFDAYCETGDTGEHLLISTGLPGCPYRMTTYREEDVAHVDLAFGVQLHHPRFLECIGAPKSALLLGRSPAEWIQVMDRQDVLVAALELQRDAGLMASNLSVLSQYVTSLHRMSTEVMQLVFCHIYFPSGAVDDAAPVPWVHRAATQMAAMGLWRPPIGPGGPGLDTIRYLIVMTVWVVPNALRDCPVEHLQSTSLACLLSCSEGTFPICIYDCATRWNFLFKTIVTTRFYPVYVS